MLCEKAFSCSSHLTIHKLSHIGEKPFKCMICKKDFSQSSDLTRHWLSHTGVKPFQCMLCEKAFSQFENLTRHKQSHASWGETLQIDIKDAKKMPGCDIFHVKTFHTSEKSIKTYIIIITFI